MIFIRAWKVALPTFNAAGEFTATLLMLVWPASMVYMTAPLREAFILFDNVAKIRLESIILYNYRFAKHTAVFHAYHLKFRLR